MRQWLMVLSTRPRQAHRTWALNESRGDEYIAAEIKLAQLKRAMGVGPY
jgi:hypothetical protein